MDVGKPSRKRRRNRWALAFVLWLCVVWGHSLMSGDASSEESMRFVFLLRPVFALFGNTDERLMTFLIRKAAHFSEYAVLMGLAVGMVHDSLGAPRTARLVTAVLWVLIPSLDETIQRFVPGRDGRLADVLIDMAGGLLGIVVGHILLRRHARRHADT